MTLAPKSTIVEKLAGRSLVHPLFDYILIAAAWSIIPTALFVYRPSLVASLDPTALAILILLANSAHFAASTVRLYSKASNFEEFPFLTLVVPILTLVGVSLVIASPDILGRHLQALYLTWSPFHYAAQTYGLVLIYCFRSGCKLSATSKRVLYWTCLLPFLRSFLGMPDAGLGWFIRRETIEATPFVASGLGVLVDVILVLTFAAPFFLAWRVHVHERKVMPLIGLVLMMTNGLWWTVLDYVNAFVIATIAHGIQYLCIVVIYDVRERLREPDNENGWLRHAVIFYGKTLALGYGLFYCWPYAYVWAGAGLVESMLLVTATINVHHFIVDRYIWRLGTPSKARSTVDTPP